MDQHKLALLSDRGRHFVGNPNMIYQHSSKIRDNLYNPENNPEGVVNMGVAENFLCEDLLIKRRCLAQSSECLVQFKNSLCKFLTRYFKAAKPLDPNKVNSFLCPAPNYAGIMSDFNGRPQVKILPVHLPLDGIDENLSQERIGEMIEIFEKVYTSEKNKVMTMITLSTKYDLHVICDEAYGLTVFDPDTAVTSLFQMSDIPDRQRTFVLWGFSKFAYFSTVPPIVQKKLQIVVSDDDWVDMFFKTNISRIRESFAYSRKTLQELAIPFKEPKAAFFIWADFTEVR
ncbi:hypothetical protein LSH36_220g07022 [Paralvinella palmiformis]|uniref:Aminotransferase class I/classII large domain-containing protein n=1 Tax=Paralvinella palmiformis TaxID=53620 RepID=A0AAD9N497_9ANNE|nr:hypothetical protein LSH36_220g07022 [Paralvinella palmiformis]